MANAKTKDLIDSQFGELTVLEFSYTDNKYRSYWKCLCSCGNEKIISRHNLITGRSKSCGIP